MATEPFTMGASTRRFQHWVGEMVRGVEQDMVPTLLRKVTFDFLRKVIKRTPVDTGRARAGWTVWLDKQGKPVNITADAPNADNRSISEGRAASDFKEKLGRGSVQWITVVNGVRYIVFLEFGGSDQAPAGMVRITIREFEMGGNLDQEMLQQLERTIIQADRTAFAGSRRTLPG